MWLTSSTAPISTMRCAWPGSRPVVSVSRMISRMSVVRISRKLCDNITDLGEGVIAPLRAVHNEIGAGAFLRVGRLASEQRIESLLRHAGPLERTRLLNFK